MDSTKFKELIAAIREEYDETFSELRIRQWWSALKEYDTDDVNRAYMDYLSGEWCRRKPKPGDLIALIKGTDKQQQTAIADVAQEQWIQVLNKIRRQGAYGQVVFDDKVTLKAIQLMGGWRELCHTNEDKMEWRRKEFIETYRNSINAQNLPESLAGIGAKDQSKIEAGQQLKQLQDGANAKR